MKMYNTIAQALKPRQVLSVSQWASKYRVLTSDTSAEVGKWNNSRTPYLVEIMDCMSKHSEVEQVYCMLPTQIGKTEAGLNWIGYVVDYVPSGMLFVDASEDAIKTKFKTRLDRMIKATPIVKNKIDSYKKANQADTRILKEFAGGFILGTGVKTSKGVRSHPAKYSYADEIDTYPVDVAGEGDPISLLLKRQSTYIDKKLYASSTPGIKHQSLIEKNYFRGDQRKYYVPCPKCGQFQILEFDRLIFECMQDVHYLCQYCDYKIREHHKEKFLSLGEWRPTKNSDNTIRSYHMNALYAPFGWTSWLQIAKEWKETKGDNAKLKTFINTVLAETWEEKGEAPSHLEIEKFKGEYSRGEVPADVCVLTAGVDIQKDRIEVEIVGWGYGLQSWSIDYKIAVGNTADSNSACWQTLASILEKPYMSFDKKSFFIELMAIDSGYNTDYVYEFVSTRDFCVSVKGVDKLREEKIFMLRGGGRTQHYSVNTFKLKGFIYDSLMNPDTLAKSHFPVDTDTEYFKQLTAEELRDKINKMGTVIGKEYHKTYERNEVLDCRVYALAAAHMFGISEWTEENFTDYREKV